MSPKIFKVPQVAFRRPNVPFYYFLVVGQTYNIIVDIVHSIVVVEMRKMRFLQVNVKISN